MSSNRLIAVAVGILLLLVGSAAQAVGGQGGQTSPQVTSPSAVAPASSSSSSPSPSTGEPAAARRVAPAAPPVPQYRATLEPVARERPNPARFSAGSIGVDLAVVATGVADDGLMQLPETNREVAWFAFGSRPGDPTGTTVLAAHVDTRAEGLGPFARLRQLDRGDDVDITDARGGVHAYTVTAVDDVKKSDIALDELFRRDGPPELKVLTCGGPYSKRTGYRDNIVVTARPR